MVFYLIITLAQWLYSTIGYGDCPPNAHIAQNIFTLYYFNQHYPGSNKITEENSCIQRDLKSYLNKIKKLNEDQGVDFDLNDLIAQSKYNCKMVMLNDKEKRAYFLGMIKIRKWHCPVKNWL